MAIPFVTLFTIFTTLIIIHGNAEIIYEDGYSVKTVVDGNKIKVNPHTVVSRPGSHELLLLDSSEKSVMKKFSGNGIAGYSDGDATSAMFQKPRSFTVDSNGNVYVADRSNFAVRKISRSGVTTTIAGGNSKTPGRADGPGRDATFSTDYELTFVPEMCALLIVDHGHKLIRQIDLKQEDCGSSKSGLGVSAIWAAALVVTCLLGLVIGFAVRPYIMPLDGYNLLNVSKSWTSYQMKLGSQTLMYYFGTRSAVASAALSFLRRLLMLVLSHISILFRFRIKRVEPSFSTVNKDHVSLLDHDNSSSSGSLSSQKYFNQLRDLITFDGDLGTSNIGNNILKPEDRVENDGDRPRQIDDLMLANVTNFAEDAHKSTVAEEMFLGISSVVKRR